MITVEKNGLKTEILEIFKEKYMDAGWKVVEKPKTSIKDEATKIIEASLDSKKASKNRQKDLVKDNQMEAEAIVATELKKEESKVFTDGLIKE